MILLFKIRLKWEKFVKLNAKSIEKKTKRIKAHSFKCVDSTNNVAKILAENGAEEGTAVVSLQQTAGRGRLGRTFLSKKGGIYLSVVLRPLIKPEDALFITVAAAVSAARAIETVSNKKCEIKWVNDIYINGKKVCGILTEGGFGADGKLEYVILGVGINLFAPRYGFPQELPLAGSVFDRKSKILQKKRKKEQTIAEFLTEFFEFYENLSKKEFIKEYQRRSFLTGKDITYTKDGATYKAKVTGIDDDARLVIKCGDKTQILSHGEIQIIGMEQLLV